jgi:hypothetical protein
MTRMMKMRWLKIKATKALVQMQMQMQKTATAAMPVLKMKTVAMKQSFV